MSLHSANLLAADQAQLDRDAQVVLLAYVVLNGLGLGLGGGVGSVEIKLGVP